jgi:hypothetical protein
MSTGGNGRSDPSLFGCLVGAIGLVFMLTGGVCVWGGFNGSGVAVLAIGLLMMVGGWLMMKAWH